MAQAHVVAPPTAVVPPANIAGDDLDIGALAAARRAERAAARAIKHHVSSPQPLSTPAGAAPAAPAAELVPNASATNTHGEQQQVEADEQQQSQQQVTSMAAEQSVAADTDNPASGSADEAELSKPLPDAEPSVTDDAKAELERNWMQDPGLLERTLESLSVPRKPLLPPRGRLTRSGSPTFYNEQLSTSRPSATNTVRASEMAIDAAAERASQPVVLNSADVAAASHVDHVDLIEAGQALSAKAVDKGVNNGPGAQDAAAQNIWNQLRSGLESGRGSLMATPQWKALRSLPQSVTQTQWMPQGMRQLVPARTPQQAARQRMIREISSMRLEPTVAHVTPVVDSRPDSAEGLVSTSTSAADAATPTAPAVTERRRAAVADLQIEQIHPHSIVQPGIRSSSRPLLTGDALAAADSTAALEAKATPPDKEVERAESANPDSTAAIGAAEHLTNLPPQQPQLNHHHHQQHQHHHQQQQKGTIHHVTEAQGAEAGAATRRERAAQSPWRDHSRTRASRVGPDR